MRNKAPASLVIGSGKYSRGRNEGDDWRRAGNNGGGITRLATARGGKDGSRWWSGIGVGKGRQENREKLIYRAYTGN